MPETPAGPPEGTYLGFDFGLRRIGVASGQTATCTANPLAVIAHGDAPDWAALERLVREWRPVGLVVGLPLDPEGEETDMSRRARAFARQLEARFGLPVHYNDERLTSRAAGELFASLRASGRARRKDAVRLDAMAAGLILQNWLKRVRTADP
ncbi:MAG: Holliday junction resolvase RuvX [Gammaproteobacteria bacterium]